MDFSKIKTYPIAKRKNKFSLEQMVSLDKSSILSANPDLVILGEKIKKSREQGKEVILMMGAHPIKLGLSLFIIDLMQKNYLTHIAMNGAGMIHDFELSYIGGTSEDVAENIKNGSFGMAHETGHYISQAAIMSSGEGLGREMGKLIAKEGKYRDSSLLYNAFKLKIPATVHTAIGTEIIYQHPECNAAALGQSSYDDFKKLADSISKLQNGVVINLGSAVILPEVFLKAFTVARNLGYKIEDFTAANLDMNNHYRPRVNIVERPTSLGGQGLTIIEKHEKSIPTLHKLLTP